MRQRRAGRRATALLLFALLAAQPVLAQGTGVLYGKVVDTASHNPVADVVVTATSPSLQGEQIIVTDGTGDYRIPQLPPGQYTLRFECSTYKPYVRENIALRLDQSIRLNVELLPDVAGSIDITVVGRVATMDVTSTTTGTSVDTNMIRSLSLVSPGVRGAASRPIESLAELAPGAQPDTYGTSIAGTTSAENGYIIDGVSVNDPAFGVSGTPLSVEFVQEVNVNTGGYLPEFGRATGGIVSAVTKSGSNEFHGSIFGNLSPGMLSAPAHPIRQEASTVTGQTRLWNLGDFGAELGGPILRDKLWFYAGLAPSFTRYQLERSLNVLSTSATGDTTQELIPGTTRDYFVDQRSVQYIGKLTYAVNADNNLTLSVFGSPTSSGGPGRFSFGALSGQPEVPRVNGEYGALATQRTSDALDASLKWSASFLEKRVLLDTTVGWHHQEASIRASDGTRVGSGQGLAAVANTTWNRTDPGPHSILDFESFPGSSVCDPAGTENAVRCPVLNYVTGGPAFLNEAAYDRYQGKLVATLLVDLLGKHVFKAGLDLETTRFVQTKGVPGQVNYLEADDGTYFQDFRQFGYLSGPDQATIQAVQKADSRSLIAGGFVQDSWNLPFNLTVNAGVRYDVQQLVGGNTVAMNLANEWSPRLGIIYDFTGAGRSKVFASYARYYEAVPLDMVDRTFPGERQVRSLKDASLCDPRDLNQQRTSCMSDDARLASRPPLDASHLWQQTGGGKTVVDPALKPQSADELIAGAEYEVLDNTRAGATYTHRVQNEIIEDMSRDDGATYFIGNPGYGLASDFPKAVRDYDAATVYLTRAFSDAWLAQASYTWSSLRGNWEGLSRSDTGQLDPNINSDFDLISLLPNRKGALAGDHTHQLKLFAAKEFPLGDSFSLNVGLSYRGNSGAPLNYLGAHDTYGPGEAFILPRGSAGRLPFTHRFDTHLGVNYRLSKDNVVSLNMDVFNLFNFQQVTAVDENYTYSAVLPIVDGTKEELATKLTTATGAPFNPVNKNPNILNAIAYQAPRSFRVGMRVTF